MTTTGLIDLPTLARMVDEDQIDTVVVAFVDVQGRLMGKRVTGQFFLDHVAGPGGEGVRDANDPRSHVMVRRSAAHRRFR